MDSFRVFRVGTLLFAMFSVGLLAVQSRPAGVLASEMWPAGLAAAALFTARRRYAAPVLALVFVLAFSTFWFGGRPIGVAFGGGVAVALEAVVIAWVLTAGDTMTPRLHDDRDLRRFTLALALGGLVAAVVTMGAVALYTAEPVWLVGLGTIVGHVSSALFLLPFLMETDDHESIAPGFERVIQWTVAVGSTVAVFVPHDFPAVLFIVIPVLGWCALRSPLREALLQLLMVATVGTVLTTFGYGPLAEAPGQYALPFDTTGILLQTFLIDCALVVIPLSLVVGQQVEAARSARVERDRVQQIVNSANVAIIGTDEAGRVTLFNPGAQRLLGYEPDDVLGRFTPMFHSAEEITAKAQELGVPDDFVTVARKLAEPESAGIDIRFRRKDGVERTHSMTLSRIVDDRGVVTGYVSTSEDISDRVSAHQALVEALETERRAVERLREVDQVKETFVSGVSHELRTPITSIVGYLELLQDGSFGELNPDQTDAVTRVEANSKRLLSLIDELLTLSRVQEEGLGLVDREIDLVDVVRTAHDVVAPAWSHRDLTVSLELPGEPVPFTGDEDMLERVVVNLLGNAVKFTPDGGRVSLCLASDAAGSVIQVSDSGIGIPVDEQVHLFTRFFRSSTAQERAIPGSGLGLSIARAIVEMHGGAVVVESAPGAGATFRVTIPPHA